MPDILPASSKIGTLLRKLAETQSESITEVTPQDQPSAPLRETVQAPLESPIAPESPQSNRVISLQPEGAANPVMGAAPQESIAPTTSKVGGVGGPGFEGAQPGLPSTGETRQFGQAGTATPNLQPNDPGFVGTPVPEAEALYINELRAQEQAGPPPTLQDYLSKGKTAAQFYAETGGQSTLDEIGRSGGVRDFNQFLTNADTGDRGLVADPITGQLQRVQQSDAPNTATLEEYLAQGKTAEQWLQETGRQGELDRLSQGGRVAVNPQSVMALARQFSPPAQAAGQQGDVLGATTLLPSGEFGTEFTGPLRPGEARPVQLMPQALVPSTTPDFIGPLRPDIGGQAMSEISAAESAQQASQARIAEINALEVALNKPPEQRTPEEERLVRLNASRSVGDRMAQQRALGLGMPTPTPRPVITR